VLATQRPWNVSNCSFDAVLFEAQYASSTVQALQFGNVRRFHWSTHIEPVLHQEEVGSLLKAEFEICWDNLTDGDYRVRVKKQQNDGNPFWNGEEDDGDDHVFDADCLRVSQHVTVPRRGFEYIMPYFGTNSSHPSSPCVGFLVHENATVTQSLNMWVRNSQTKSQECRIFASSPYCYPTDGIRWITGKNFEFVVLPSLVPSNPDWDFVFGAVSNTAVSSFPLLQPAYMTLYTTSLQDVSLWFKNKIPTGKAMIACSLVGSVSHKRTNKQLNKLSDIGKLKFIDSFSNAQYNNNDDNDLWSYF
jgi:hypothetical protein